MIKDWSTSIRYTPTYDGNGNVYGLIDATTDGPDAGNDPDGDLAAAYEYGPFGEPLRASGPDAFAAKNSFRYSTKYFDVETGLYYYGLRFYNATTGRFINRDPIGESGGLNLYGFVGNDPINRWDFLGLCDDGDHDISCDDVAGAVPPVPGIIDLPVFEVTATLLPPLTSVGSFILGGGGNSDIITLPEHEVIATALPPLDVSGENDSEGGGDSSRQERQNQILSDEECAAIAERIQNTLGVLNTIAESAKKRGDQSLLNRIASAAGNLLGSTYSATAFGVGGLSTAYETTQGLIAFTYSGSFRRPLRHLTGSNDFARSVTRNARRTNNVLRNIKQQVKPFTRNFAAVTVVVDSTSVAYNTYSGHPDRALATVAGVGLVSSKTLGWQGKVVGFVGSGIIAYNVGRANASFRQLDASGDAADMAARNLNVSIGFKNLEGLLQEYSSGGCGSN